MNKFTGRGWEKFVVIRVDMVDGCVKVVALKAQMEKYND